MNISLIQKTKLIKNHQQQTSQQTSITKLAELFSPSCLITEPEIPPANAARKSREKYTNGVQYDDKEQWKQHARAGRFIDELEKNYIDKNASLEWLKKGKLRFDAERIIIAAQDQGLITNGIKKNGWNE